MKLKKLFISAVIAVAAITFSGCFDRGLSYDPWVDLSNHFDLGKVEIMEAGYCRFNSFELCEGLTPYRNERLNDQEYTATVLGRNVLLRSEPKISPRTVRGSVNTGDIISVLRASEFMNGKFWNYVYVSSGRSAGKYGYICTDYLIEQEQYRVLSTHVFASRNSNLSDRAESKYLNAISSILLKLKVDEYCRNISADVVDAQAYGNQAIVAFRICNFDVRENDSLLAFVQFIQNENDFVVLGVVPGRTVHSIQPHPNGSYTIEYVL